MCKWLCIVWLVALLGPAESGATLGSGLLRLQAEVRSLAGLAPQASPGWGQQQALDDLQRVADLGQQLEAALASDPGVTPAALHGLREQLTVSKSRLQASLPLLGVEPGAMQALLVGLEQLVNCLRTLEYRFDGRAPMLGPALAQAPLDLPPRLPIYANPRELWDEARNVRWLAESFTRLRSVWRGEFSPGWGWGAEFYEFLGAACDFETACLVDYPSVAQTRPTYRRLVRAYERARSFGYGLDSFRWSQLDKAFGRLELFYASAP